MAGSGGAHAAHHGNPGLSKSAERDGVVNKDWKRETFKQKDMMGLPWRVAFALQDDGWYLRSDIIWHKPNPMPQSVTDRPTTAHEYIFLLSKRPRYFYDMEAIREHKLRNHYGITRIVRSTMSGGHQVRTIAVSNHRMRVLKTGRFPEPTPATCGRFRPPVIRATITQHTQRNCRAARYWQAQAKRACAPNAVAPWRREVETTAMEVKPSPKHDSAQIARGICRC